MSKPWWRSRTVAVQLASIALAVLVYVAGAGIFEGLGLSAQQADVARNWVTLITAILNAATIGLRSGGGSVPLRWR